MHLRNYPHYFVKNGDRRAAYYTAEVRELLALGWQREKAASPEPAKEEVQTLVQPIPVEQEDVGAIAEVIIEAVVANDDEQDEETAVSIDEYDDKTEGILLPNFDFMTKAELLQYAENKGVNLPSNALKAELVAECRKLSDG